MPGCMRYSGCSSGGMASPVRTFSGHRPSPQPGNADAACSRPGFLAVGEPVILRFHRERTSLMAFAHVPSLGIAHRGGRTVVVSVLGRSVTSRIGGPPTIALTQFCTLPRAPQSALFAEAQPPVGISISTVAGFPPCCSQMHRQPRMPAPEVLSRAGSLPDGRVVDVASRVTCAETRMIEHDAIAVRMQRRSIAGGWDDADIGLNLSFPK